MTSKRIVFQVYPILAMLAFAVFYLISESTVRTIANQSTSAVPTSIIEPAEMKSEHTVLPARYRISAFLIFGILCLMSGFCLHWKDSRTTPTTRPAPDTDHHSAMVDLGRDAKMIVSGNGKINHINPAFTKIFGISSREIVGAKIKTCIEKVSELSEDKQELHDCLKSWITENSNAPVEFVILNPARRVLRAQRMSILDENKKESGSIWHFEDITTRRELEYEVRQAQKMEVVGQLTMGLAHDFNNLLTGINGNLAILEMEMETKKVDLAERKNLRFAIQAGLRAGELVKQLLGFSQRDNQHINSFEAGTVINEVTGILKASIDPSTRLQPEIADDLWHAKGDSNMLSQVLINLMKNAHDALPDGGTIEVTAENSKVSLTESGWSTSTRSGDFINSKALEKPFTLTSSSKPGEFVHISVKDDGIGMSPEVKSKIFDAFYTTKGSGKGTGLGLSTSLKIIERLGGWISVDSEEGKGTRFDIFLLRGQSVETKNNCTKFKLKETRKNTEPKGTILIVDDEEMVRMVAMTLLKRAGYRVLPASNGQEALKVYEEKRDEISLVMLDLTMPKLSGEGTFAYLRENYGHVPVLICSGHLVDLTAFEEKVGYCPDGFVQKPYRIEKLVTSIQDVLEGKNCASLQQKKSALI